MDVTLSDVRSLLGFLRVQPAFSLNGIYYSRDQAGDLNRFGAVWRAGVSANTAVYGTFTPGLGPLRAIRHVITPTVSFAFQPEQQGLFFTDETGIRSPDSRECPGSPSWAAGRSCSGSRCGTIST